MTVTVSHFENSSVHHIILYYIILYYIILYYIILYYIILYYIILRCALCGETWKQSSVHGDISTLKIYAISCIHRKALLYLQFSRQVCRTDQSPRVNRPKERCCCNARDRDMSCHGQRLGSGMTDTCPGIWKIPPLRFQCMPLSAVELNTKNVVSPCCYRLSN